MARDRANINTNIWTDTHWRQRTSDQQWLYELLLTHPELSYAGVADWRPGRLSQFVSDKTADDIKRIGSELQTERFIFIDESTEEVLIRSFLRHDGLLKQPRLSISMVNAYGAVASNEIREVIIHELKRMHVQDPTLNAFKNAKVVALLGLPASPMDRFTHPSTQAVTQAVTQEPTLAVTPSFTPNPAQAQALHTSTATTTSTSTSNEVDKRGAPQKRGTRIPGNFHVTSEMAKWSSVNAPNVDINLETTKFKNYWEAKAGRDASKLDWIKTWHNWILRSHPAGTTTNKPGTADKMRATFALGQQMQAQQNQPTQYELGV